MSITSLFPRERSTARNPQPAASTEVLDELRELNRQYVAAVGSADVTWLREHLADEALLVLGDGRRVHKPEYLRMLEHEPRQFRSLGARDVTVRPFGDTVQVDAEAPWELADGRRGVSRYIDTWLRLDGRWQVVSAQVTPLPSPAGS